MKTRMLAWLIGWANHPHALRLAFGALALIGAVFRLATPPADGGSPS
ncbi:hypothetical protein [Thermoflexus sp.]